MSLARLIVCRRVRLKIPHLAVRQQVVSSSWSGTQRHQTLSATATRRATPSQVDSVARCRFSAERRPRVSGSGHHADLITTSVNIIHQTKYHINNTDNYNR